MDEFGDLSGTTHEDLKHRGMCGRNPGQDGSLSKLTQCVIGYNGLCRPFASIRMVSCAVASFRLELSLCWFFKLIADATPPEQEPSQFAGWTGASNF